MLKEESVKSLKEYTKEELSQLDLDAGTIADLLWNEWKINGKPQTLRESLLEYENKHRIDHWD